MTGSTKLQVLTRDRYLAQIQNTALALTQDRTLDTDPVNAWAERCLKQLKRQGRLVSERQYQDHLHGRVLQEGDRARFVGDTREEHLGKTHYTRPHGQAGSVTQVKRQGGEYLITFRPDAPAPVQSVVELVVRTNTPGYFTLEREENP